MAVHRHHLPNVAGGPPFLDERPDRAVTRVPRRLVVDEDVDARRGRRRAESSVRARCSRPAASPSSRRCRAHAAASTTTGWSKVLVKAATASGFARSSMAARSVNNTVSASAVPLRVLSLQGRVGVEDADDLHVLARLGGPEESGHVPVHETGDREPERRGGALLRVQGKQGGENTGSRQRRKQQSLHGVILPGREPTSRGTSTRGQA